MEETETGDMAAIGTETGEVVVETDSEAVEAVDAMEVVEEEAAVAGSEAEAMVAAAEVLEEEAVSRESSPVEDSEPSTGAESVSNPSRRTSTTPPVPAETWTPGTSPSSGETYKYFSDNVMIKDLPN